MRAIIIGFMASGKTTVAKLLGKRLNTNIYDLDMLIESQTKMSINEYFHQFSEQQFRKLEHSTLKRALSKSGILAIGGGTPMKDDNFKLIRNSHIPIIMLNASNHTVLNRLTKGEFNRRPLCEKLGKNGLIKLKNNRQPIYEQLADYKIDVNKKSVLNIIQNILNQKIL